MYGGGGGDAAAAVLKKKDHYNKCIHSIICILKKSKSKSRKNYAARKTSHSLVLMYKHNVKSIRHVTKHHLRLTAGTAGPSASQGGGTCVEVVRTFALYKGGKY